APPPGGRALRDPGRRRRRGAGLDSSFLRADGAGSLHPARTPAADDRGASLPEGDRDRHRPCAAPVQDAGSGCGAAGTRGLETQHGRCVKSGSIGPTCAPTGRVPLDANESGTAGIVALLVLLSGMSACERAGTQTETVTVWDVPSFSRPARRAAPAPTA